MTVSYYGQHQSLSQCNNHYPTVWLIGCILLSLTTSVVLQVAVLKQLAHHKYALPVQQQLGDIIMTIL